MYLKLELGGGYSGTRMYFSMNDTFGLDYIQFNSTEVGAPIVYYMKPDTFYVVDRDSSFITDIKNHQFKIKYISHVSPPEITLDADSATVRCFVRVMKNRERIDSCLKSKADYTIMFGEYGLDFTVFNSDCKAIISSSTDSCSAWVLLFALLVVPISFIAVNLYFIMYYIFKRR